MVFCNGEGAPAEQTLRRGEYGLAPKGEGEDARAVRLNFSSISRRSSNIKIIIC